VEGQQQRAFGLFDQPAELALIAIDLTSIKIGIVYPDFDPFIRKKHNNRKPFGRRNERSDIWGLLLLFFCYS